MTTREVKYRAVKERSEQLGPATETFNDLAVWLNAQGFTTGYGTPDQGGRGVATVVRHAWHFHAVELGLGDAGAASIAEAFTNASGKYAYDE